MSGFCSVTETSDQSCNLQVNILLQELLFLVPTRNACHRQYKHIADRLTRLLIESKDGLLGWYCFLFRRDSGNSFPKIELSEMISSNYIC